MRKLLGIHMQIKIEITHLRLRANNKGKTLRKTLKINVNFFVFGKKLLRSTVW